MGAHLGWEPATPQPLGGSLCSHMKHLLRERFANGDEAGLWGMELDVSIVSWLEGVRDAAGTADSDWRTDAEDLIAAIREHKVIRIVHT